MNKEQVNQFLKHYDFKGLAEAFAKGDMEWHEKEWKEFIGKIRQETVEKTVEDYTNWLLKHNYVDSDVYTEEPKAVDAYLHSLKGLMK